MCIRDSYQTVTQLITGALRGDLFPVGRLDIDTEGLLLLTNDGALAHNLLSPRKHVDKVYFARIEGKLPGDAVGRRQPAWCWRTARKPFRPVWKSWSPARCA